MNYIMKSTIILLLLISYIACDFSSQNYLNLSAKAKMDSLWSKITENQTPFGWYSSFSQAAMFFEDMTKSFDILGDEFLDGRKKYIHTVGRIAKAQFVSTGDHPYTGVFRGTSELLIRLSCAKEPDTKKTTAVDAYDNFAPGMALKFLRNGSSSANIVAMFSTNGQNSWNFFKNDFSNHVPSSQGATLKALGLVFSSATSYIQTIGLKDLALQDTNGVIYNPSKYPFKLIFRPTDQLRSKYSDYLSVDFMSQLAAVSSGTTLYDVYAIDQPNQKEKKIGSIKTTSQMTSSLWGDESMYFRHNYMDIDLEENPSWINYVPEFSIFGSKLAVEDVKTKDEKKKCPFYN